MIFLEIDLIVIQKLHLSAAYILHISMAKQRFKFLLSFPD